MKSQNLVIHKQSRFVDLNVCSTSVIFEFRVYVLSHAIIERLHITYETLTQYQRELDANQLTKDILSKKIDDIVALRKERNYNKVVRINLYKSS